MSDRMCAYMLVSRVDTPPADLIPAGAHATMTLAFSIRFETCRTPLY